MPGRSNFRLLELPIAQAHDNRVDLIFTCCHPALATESQIALTLRAVCGLTTAQIARALVVSEATVAQRIVRAQRKIARAGIPHPIPGRTSSTNA